MKYCSENAARFQAGQQPEANTVVIVHNNCENKLQATQQAKPVHNPPVSPFLFGRRGVLQILDIGALFDNHDRLRIKWPKGGGGIGALTFCPSSLNEVMH